MAAGSSCKKPMKPDFALNLSHEGLSLLRRAGSGWRVMGEVALDAPDLSARLAALRRTANELSDGNFTTKLLIPNSEILYRELDLPEAPHEQRSAAVAEALDGLTPYALDELAFDWEPAGEGRIRLAAVTLQILGEAEEFAAAHGFNPVCFTAIPPQGAFMREPFFGTIRSGASWLGDAGAIGPEECPIDIIGHDAPPKGGAEAPAASDAEPALATGSEAGPPERGGARMAPAAAPGPALGPEAGPSCEEAISGQASIRAEMETLKAEFFTARTATDAAPETAPARVGERLESIEPRILLYPDRAEAKGNEATSQAPMHTPPLARDGAQQAPETPPAPRPEDGARGRANRPIIATRSASGMADPALSGIGARRERGAAGRYWPLVLLAALILALLLAGLWLLRPAPMDGHAQLEPGSTTAQTPAPASANPVQNGTLESGAATAGASDAGTAPERATNGTANGAAANAGNNAGAPRLDARARTGPSEAAAPAQDASAPPNAISAPPALPRLGPAQTALPRGGAAPESLPHEGAGAPISAPLQVGIQAPAPVSPEQPPAAGPAGAQGPAVAMAPDLRLPAPAPLAQPQTGRGPGADRALPAPAPPVQGTQAQGQEGPANGTAEARALADSTDPAAPPDLERDRITTLFVPGIDLPIRQRAAAPPGILAQEGANGSAATLEDPRPRAQLPPPPPGTRFELDARGLVKASKEGTLNPDGIRIYAGPPPRVVPLRPDSLAQKARREAARAAEEARKARARKLAAMASFRPVLRPESIGGKVQQASGEGTDPAAPAEPAAGSRDAASPKAGAPDQTRSAAPDAQQGADASALPLSPQQLAMKSFRPRLRPSSMDRAVRAALQEALPAPAPPPAGLKRPVLRPPDFSSAIKRALAAAGASRQSQSAPRASAGLVSPLPSKASVAREATLQNALGRHRVTLIGVFGTRSDRRALVRLPGGRLVKVKVGDRIDGGQIAEIGTSSLKYIKRGRIITLEIAS